MAHFIFLILITTLIPSMTHAKDLDIPAVVRLHVGLTTVDPKELNTELEGQGLKKIDSLNNLGFEGTYSILRMFEVGVRYSRKSQTSNEDPDNPATFYRAELKQDAVALIARVPVLNTNLLRVEAFGGAGGANTKFTIRSASQDGEMTRMSSDKAGSSLYSVYGATVAVGWKRVYFMVEGGFENNSFGSLTRTGTVSNNVQKLNLTGSFFTIGLLLDGLATKKK